MNRDKISRMNISYLCCKSGLIPVPRNLLFQELLRGLIGIKKMTNLTIIQLYEYQTFFCMTYQLFFFQLNKPVSHYLLKTFTFISTTFLLTFSCGGRGGGETIYTYFWYIKPVEQWSAGQYGECHQRKQTQVLQMFVSIKLFPHLKKNQGNLQYTCNTSTCISEIY